MPVERLVEELDVADDLVTAHRVRLDRVELVVGELARLLQHRGRDAELADVVQRARVLDRVDTVLVHGEPARDHHAGAGDALAVTAGVGVLGLDRLHERADRGLVRVALGGVLAHRPARDEQRHEDEGQRERADLLPEHRDQQAERAVRDSRYWEAVDRVGNYCQWLRAFG